MTMINEVPQPRCSSKPWLWGYSNDNSLPLSTNSSLFLFLSLSSPSYDCELSRCRRESENGVKMKSNQRRKRQIFPFQKPHPFIVSISQNTSNAAHSLDQRSLFNQNAFHIRLYTIQFTLFFITTHNLFIHQHRKIALITLIVRSHRCLILRSDGAHQISHK